MEYTKEQVILISAIPYRDSDLVTNFLSKTHGKLSAMVYRGRVLGKSSSFTFQPGDLLEMEYQIKENKDFVTISNLVPIELINPEKYTYRRFIFHSYLLEIVAKITRPAITASDLFDIILHNNHVDWDTTDQNYIIGWSLWQLIKHGGFEIDFHQCHHCENPSWKMSDQDEAIFRRQRYQVSDDLGAILCEDCVSQSGHNEILSSSMIKLLWLFEHGPITPQTNRAVPKEISLPLVSRLNLYLLHHYEINPKSLSLFESLISVTRNEP